jgi:hypothetical protein
MGRTIPWVSSFGSNFNHAFGVGPESPQPSEDQDGESFGLSVFLRDGKNVYRTPRAGVSRRSAVSGPSSI